MNYTAEDEILIDRRWNELVESCRKARICKNEEDWNFIRRAFFLAKEAHKASSDARASRIYCTR